MKYFNFLNIHTYLDMYLVDDIKSLIACNLKLKTPKRLLNNFFKTGNRILKISLFEMAYKNL